MAASLFARYKVAKKYFTSFEDTGNIAVPQIGSEISASGLLVRNIEGYRSLRKGLEAPNSIVPDSDYQFLPRVPKDLQGKISQFDFARSADVPNHVLIPYMLQRWGSVRKAITVEPGTLTPLDLRKEYWLDALPYPALYIRYENELRLDNSARSPRMARRMPEGGWDMTNILLVEGDRRIGEVHMMVWSDAIERCILTESELVDLESSIRAVLTAKRHNALDAFRSAAKITDNWVGGFCGIASVLPGGVGVAYDRTLKRVETSVYTMDDHKTFAALLGYVNWVCRIMAESYTRSSVQANVQPDSLPLPPSPVQRPWHEVPISQTIEIGRAKPTSSRAIVRRIGGYTVQPHYRKEYTRRVRYKKDGVWEYKNMEFEGVLVNKHLADQGVPIKGGGVHIKK